MRLLQTTPIHPFNRYLCILAFNLQCLSDLLMWEFLIFGSLSNRKNQFCFKVLFSFFLRYSPSFVLWVDENYDNSAFSEQFILKFSDKLPYRSFLHIFFSTT